MTEEKKRKALSVKKVFLIALNLSFQYISSMLSKDEVQQIEKLILASEKRIREDIFHEIDEYEQL